MPTLDSNPGPATLPVDVTFTAAVPPPERPPAERALPPTIGRYVIVGELGRGGHGVVYRGLDPALKRPAARGGPFGGGGGPRPPRPPPPRGGGPPPPAPGPRGGGRAPPPGGPGGGPSGRGGGPCRGPCPPPRRSGPPPPTRRSTSSASP